MAKDDKEPKIMDVSRPGKSAPPPSAKPIIVSNRPMLKQDPMMAAPTPDGLESTPAKPEADNVSRTAKTVPVMTPAAKAGAGVPLQVAISAASAAQSKASESASAPEPEKTEAKPGEEPTAGQPPAAQTPVETSPTATPAEAKLDAEPKADQPATDSTPASTEASPEPTAPAAAAPAASDSIGPDGVTDEDGSDSQLAPNQALEAAKQHEEEARAARQAEEEKIIASKQYYLPIVNIAERRGLDRVLLVLALVLVLVLVWADIVLDAGIIHIGGVHAFTHFFK